MKAFLPTTGSTHVLLLAACVAGAVGSFEDSSAMVQSIVGKKGTRMLAAGMTSLALDSDGPKAVITYDDESIVEVEGKVMDNTAVFTFVALNLQAETSVTLKGSKPMQIHSQGTMHIDTTIDASALSDDGDATEKAKLGGFDGGVYWPKSSNSVGFGPGKGGGRNSWCCAGGGGAGFGGNGGSADAGGGGTYGTASLLPWSGQGGSGAGGGTNAGGDNKDDGDPSTCTYQGVAAGAPGGGSCEAGANNGGGGGGALILSASDDITLGSNARIFAKGSNVTNYYENFSRAGGGGSGGALLLYSDGTITWEAGAEIDASGGHAFEMEAFKSGKMRIGGKNFADDPTAAGVRGGGAGGGGRVAIYCSGSFDESVVKVLGGWQSRYGANKIGGDHYKKGGADGTVHTATSGSSVSSQLPFGSDSGGLTWTAPPTPAPTPQPTPTPTPGLNQRGHADPHVVNVRGEHFDIMQEATHTFVQVPRAATAENTLLKIDAEVQRYDPTWCNGMYITRVTMTGKLLEQFGTLTFSTRTHEEDLSKVVLVRASGNNTDVDPEELFKFVPESMAKLHLGYMLWAPDARSMRTMSVKLNFDGLETTVDWVHQDFSKHKHAQRLGKINFLDFGMRGLSKLLKRFDLHEVGGLLGEDDHESVGISSSGCEKERSLRELEDDPILIPSTMFATY